MQEVPQPTAMPRIDQAQLFTADEMDNFAELMPQSALV